jgi:hypothetical protein
MRDGAVFHTQLHLTGCTEKRGRIKCVSADGKTRVTFSPVKRHGVPARPGVFGCHLEAAL